MATEEEIGYQDGIRHVLRVLRRRLRALEAMLDNAADARTAERVRERMEEVHHLIGVIESLHR
jgi:hypothetical protein